MRVEGPTRTMRGVPVPDGCDLHTAIGGTRRERDGLVLLVGRGIGALRRGPAAAGAGEAVRGSRRVRRAFVRRTRAKLPLRYGETPATRAAHARPSGR